LSFCFFAFMTAFRDRLPYDRYKTLRTVSEPLEGADTAQPKRLGQGVSIEMFQQPKSL